MKVIPGIVQLLSLISTLSGSTSTFTDALDSKVVPTAYATAGGGFITMTESMGIIRAWDESQILNNTTHTACISGGCWFSVQFTYSEEFYESALGLDGKTVPEFVSTWGSRYKESVEEAVALEKFENLTFVAEFESNKCVLDIDNTEGISLADIITAAIPIK